MKSFIDLFTLDKTIAKPLIANLQYAWQVLPLIHDFIMETGKNLGADYEEVYENVWVGRGTTIESNAVIKGPAIIGHDCELRSAAFIRENVIVGNEVVVGNSTELKNSILFDHVEVPHFNYVGDSVIGHKAHLGAGVIISNLRLDKANIIVSLDGEKLDTGLIKFGALIGDRAEIGCNSVINPGAIIGKDTVIFPLRTIGGVVPDGKTVRR